MLPLEMHVGASIKQGDYMMDHLEEIVTVNISFSSYEQDSFSSA